MSARENVVRIPFNIYRNNPEHEKVYKILEKQENRSAFIRSAILADYEQMQNRNVLLEEVRNIVRAVNREQMEILLERMAELLEKADTKKESAEKMGKTTRLSKFDMLFGANK